MRRWKRATRSTSSTKCICCRRQAFNALLKTLEEPPPHVKFIFATTEIRKLPVTVLSRCQRFDLRRIEPDALIDHLKSIAEKEGAKVDAEGLAMIARAAEGSVRDALSILDQALVQPGANGKVASAEDIREMLGLADRSQVWDLLNAALSGDIKTALLAFRAQYDAGADPAVILRDMLELVHLLTRVKAAGPEAASHGAAGEADATRARDMAGALQMNALTRAWSLLMKGLQETQTAPDPAAAGEMALIRLGYAADLPTPDEALRALKNNPGASSSGQPASSGAPSGGGSGARAVANGGAQAVAQASVEPAPQQDAAPKAALATFKDVVRLAAVNRDSKLRTELESYVHIVAFEQGRIEMRLNDRAPTDLAGPSNSCAQTLDRRPLDRHRQCKPRRRRHLT